MKKILFMIAIMFGLIFSADAYARFGRVGGFRHSGFRSHSYSRSISHSTPKSSTVKSSPSTVKSNAKAVKSTANTNTVSKATKTVGNKTNSKSTITNSTNKTVTNSVVHEHYYGSNAPLWFLIGHSTANDKVTIINNTNEKFSCNDCESVKDEKEVYTACMKKCVK